MICSSDRASLKAGMMTDIFFASIPGNRLLSYFL
jgi:hypothetical protein